jgi:hypothetical protein
MIGRVDGFMNDLGMTGLLYGDGFMMIQGRRVCELGPDYKTAQLIYFISNAHTLSFWWISRDF